MNAIIKVDQDPVIEERVQEEVDHILVVDQDRRGVAGLDRDLDHAVGLGLDHVEDHIVVGELEHHQDHVVDQKVIQGADKEVEVDRQKLRAEVEVGQRSRRDKEVVVGRQKRRENEVDHGLQVRVNLDLKVIDQVRRKKLDHLVINQLIVQNLFLQVA